MLIDNFFLLITDPELSTQGETIAKNFNFTITSTPPSTALYLKLTPQGLELILNNAAFKPITIDFGAKSLIYRINKNLSINQPLARACGITSKFKPKILDANAGYGKDAFLLAALGARLDLVERHPLIAAILQTAIENGLKIPQISHILANFEHLFFVDAKTYLETTTTEYDVIYLDPMYPKRHKTALVKKNMQALQQIVGFDDDADLLLKLAVTKANRVVVKRPKTAAPLAFAPNFCIKAPNTRFDIYNR